MKKFKRAVSWILSLCLLFSLLPINGWSLELVMAAENGTLQNGALTANADGWKISGDFTLNNEETCGYGFNEGYLGIWTKAGATGTFSISQTISNMSAGDYQTKLFAVGNGNQGASTSPDNMTLTVHNTTKNVTKTVKITTDGWDNWNNQVSAEKLTVDKGDTVTITISGTLAENEWYGIKNVVFDTDTTIEAPITVQKVDGLSKDFIHGVDVSMYLSEVQSGVKYYDENGKEQNLFQILKDAGVNYVRLRLWNCPFAVDQNGDYKYVDEAGNEYKAGQVTKITQADGGYEEYFSADGTQVYREGYGAGNCGIDTVTAIGKIATEYGMKVLIDFHYSDFWADPKKQSVPKAWKDMNLQQKTEALSKFTTDSLNTLKEAGVDVGMVQIGNEINNGMAGEMDSANVYTLLKAGSAAVRAVDSNILVAVHFTDPQSEGYQLRRARELSEAGVDYDVFATSYYPFWHGTPAQLTTNLKEIADTYKKKVMVAEISYAWTFQDGDGYGNVVNGNATDQTFPYPIDVEGQATAVRDAIAAVAAVGENGIGTFYWEPAWVPVNVYDASAADAAKVLEANKKAWRLYGSGWGSIYGAEVDPEIKDDLNGGTWDNQAFFDFTGKVLPSINVYKWVYTGAEGPTRVSTVTPASYQMNYKAVPQLPTTVEVNLNDGTSFQAPVTWNTAQVEKLKTANFGDYTIEGTVGEFSYNTRGEEIKVAAGTWKTTCEVKVAGKNYIKNGSFEDNDGSASGWNLINYLGDNVGFPKVDKSSSNAKSGLYYYTAWDASNIDFALEQEIKDNFEKGYYSLFAYYQGTGVAEVKDTSSLYATVSYKDGSKKEYKAKVEIKNVWKDFYQAMVKDIPINNKVESVKVGTRLSCTGTEIGAWLVIDDISLMKQGGLPAYKVTFKDGNETVNTQTISLGEDAAAPEVTKKGYSLKWDKSFKNITKDLTVNAKWTANTYKIKYNVNGGSKLKTTTKEVTYGKNYGKLASPKRTGYTFSGWYTAKTKGKKITADSKVSITNDMTLYAKWTANTYKIKYNVNGGSKLKTTTKKVTYGKNYGKLASVKRAGYTFSGWYTAKTKGKKITADSKVSITKDTTLYAHWKKVTKPAKVKTPTLKNPSKGTLKISFKKVKDAKGYIIKYSTDKKFKKGTVKSVETTKLSKSINKLKKGKTYYVKVCAYKKDSAGKKVSGAYSPVKSIKLKK